ncbi:MAG: hypothetical protein AABX51_09195, partial [Nanoarchaeota archaeon]
KWFKENLPASIGDIDLGLINEVLGISAASASKQTASSVQKISLPNGKFLFRFDGGEYISNSDSEPPELIAAKNFKKEHPRAKETDFITMDGETIYSEDGKYILKSGDKYEGDAIKTEIIGRKEYEAIYSFQGNKPNPTKILIGDDFFELNSNVLSQLRSNVVQGDTLAVINNQLIHTKTTTKEVGKQDDDNYRKSTKTTTWIYNPNQGLAELIVVEQTINKNGYILDKKEVKTIFTYDDKSKKDVPDEVIETTYEKDENGIIDESKSMTLFTNAKTGEPITIIYSVDHPRKGKEIEDLELLKTQYKSRQFFAQLESALTEFAGLGYYATLFFSKEDLDLWRENVDKIFATLYLGTDYWESAICQEYAGVEGKGVAYVQTKLGLGAVAAHIEASRSEQIIGPGTENQQTGIVKPTREFLYKITFNVKNGDYEKDPKALEKMRFNIILKGERAAELFRNDIELSKGGQFGHTGRNAIVQYSSFFYNKICISFDDVPTSWSIDDELCNTIIGPSEPTSVVGGQQQSAQQQESAGGNILDI